MKRIIFIAMLTALVAGCTKGPQDDPKKETFDASKALKFKCTCASTISVNAGSPVSLEWAEGDEIAIVAESGKAVATKADAPAVLKYTAPSAGATAIFQWADYAYVSDAAIAAHSFKAYYPYSAVSAAGEFEFTVPTTQEGTLDAVKSYMPMKATAEIANPIDGATVLVKFSAEAALLRIAAPEGTEVSGLEFQLGDRKIILNGSTDGFFYAVIEPVDMSGKEIEAVFHTASGDAEATFEGSMFEAGKLYALKGQAVANGCYSIDLDHIDFSKSLIYEAQDENKVTLAIICKEYLAAANQQAVVVYGVKPNSDGTLKVMDSANPVGLVAKVLRQAPAGQFDTYEKVDSLASVHGGLYSFNSEVMDYTTAGSVPALLTAYVTVDQSTNETSISAEAKGKFTEATIVPRTLVLSDRGEDRAYGLVKIGRQIWMSENLATTHYNNKTEIVKAAKAAELQNATGPQYVAANSVSYVYNGDAVLTGKLAPTGWKVPTSKDAKTLLAYAGSVSSTLNLEKFKDYEVNNNVTGFSSRYAGRVTSKWDNSLDPCYWCSDAKDESTATPKMQCFVLRNAGTAPATSAQSYKYGFWVRLMRGLY